MLIPTGLSLQIPPGYEAQVRPRSGLALRHGITMVNAPGTIDSDYRGEVGVLLINLGQEEFVVEPGARVGQLMLEHGRFGGEVVIAEAAIDDLLRPAVDVPPRILGRDEPVSGLGWFLNHDGFLPSLPPDAFVTAGAGHQVIVVAPSQGLVLVRQGEGLGSATWGPEFWRELEVYLLRPVVALLSASPPEDPP